MSWFSKVAWKEGLFMQPQHLQQVDRYHEHLLHARTRLITPYPWGVGELAIDRDQAQQGMLALRAVSGIMPDGTPFDAPGTGPLPLAVPVPDDAAGQFVWLTLPDASPNMRDTSPYDVEGATTRWGVVTETVSDISSAVRTEQVLELAVPRLELAIEPWNTGSLRVAGAAGFRREGLMRRWQEIGGERRDLYLDARLAGDPRP